MANIHLKASCSGGNIKLNDPTMPKYVGARAEVTRTEEGERIWLSDYKGTTEEIITEAIDSIVTNADRSLTFILPNGREITTDPISGTTDYNDLINKPQIEGVTLTGDKSFPDLDLDTLTNTEIQEIFDNLI